MKDWKLHLIFGNFLAIFWLVALYFFQFRLDISEVVLLVAVTLFATLFPDIDLRTSKARDMFSISLAFVISAVYIYFFRDTWYYALAYFVILYFLIKLIPTKHRGITHTVKFSLIFSLGMLVIVNFFLKLNQTENIFWFTVVFLSYNLHLFADRI